MLWFFHRTKEGLASLKHLQNIQEAKPIWDEKNMSLIMNGKWLSRIAGHSGCCAKLKLQGRETLPNRTAMSRPKADSSLKIKAPSPSLKDPTLETQNRNSTGLVCLKNNHKTSRRKGKKRWTRQMFPSFWIRGPARKERSLPLLVGAQNSARCPGGHNWAVCHGASLLVPSCFHHPPHREPF